ncbi:MAG: FMN-binding protein [Candidatus Aureabacteria bacterium]|nr:FMN-binding protein [Candidatus Auribacterota bacterium]
MSEVKKKENGILLSSITLFVITAAAAFLLSVVFTKTKDKIYETEQNKKIRSYEIIFPKSNFGKEKINDGQTFVEVKNNDKELIGYIIFAEGKGYSSTIKIAYGIDLRSKLIGIKVISQQETPGLGARCEEIKATSTLITSIKDLFKKEKTKKEKPGKPWFQEQYNGLTIDDLWLKKEKDTGHIDSITGATITSDAITKAIRESLEKFLKGQKEELQN